MDRLALTRCFVCAFEIPVALHCSAQVPCLLTLLHLIGLLLNKESNILNISSGHLWCKNLECCECHDKILVKIGKDTAEFSSGHFFGSSTLILLLML